MHFARHSPIFALYVRYFGGTQIWGHTMSQTSSIGEKSDDLAGQGRVLTTLRQSRDMLAIIPPCHTRSYGCMPLLFETIGLDLFRHGDDGHLLQE
ncbi:hypothetical protein TNCV_3470161 [Trichonephila clavipes]|nr:hypothetical protein TNCV_3470161 [Trichonephila clavipes]